MKNMSRDCRGKWMRREDLNRFCSLSITDERWQGRVCCYDKIDKDGSVF
jgi:hypothetical protein